MLSFFACFPTVKGSSHNLVRSGTMGHHLSLDHFLLDGVIMGQLWNETI